MNLKTVVFIPLILFSIILSACTIPRDQKEQTDVSENTKQVSSPTPSPTATPQPETQTKLDTQVDLCTQISADFVSQATGIAIAKAKNINDTQINACDYYLTDEKNSPYIAIIVNKNLSVTKQKEIAAKKFVLKTDPNISGDHYAVWADNESRIVNINLILDDNNFIRIDKNVERAIDNEGLLKLASAVAKKI
ncbi:hypothetical protein GYA49_00365 [Candidatus Beckwithbacteria bacterium]|nr:hypothetical protein [Candidatus Beckwithbacteria bacterium]